MIGIVGDEAEAVAELVEAADEEAVTGDAADVLAEEPAATVALGESSLYELVRAGVEVPVLPVNAGTGVEAVRRDDLGAAIERLAAGDVETHDRRTLGVSVGDSEFTALADAMLVTHEPAQISEYGVRGTDDAGDLAPVDAVRADGIVVSTPTGSVGYGSDAGGPVVSPAVDAVGVVPIAPFRVGRSRWVLAPPVRLTVEREEATVALLVDDRQTRLVSTDEPVDLSWDGSVTLVRSAASQRFFEGAERLEKT